MRQTRTTVADALRRDLLKSNLLMAKQMEEILHRWGRSWICLTIDGRYRMIDGLESCLTVSYGVNITPVGFLSPPEQSGDVVFGLQNVVATKENTLHLVDSWLNSYPAMLYSSFSQVETEARRILDRIDKKEYSSQVTFMGKVGEFATSPVTALTSFAIGDAW